MRDNGTAISLPCLLMFAHKITMPSAMIFRGFPYIAAMFFCWQTVPAYALTLQQAYESARANAESVQIKQLGEDQAQSRVDQARGALLPSLEVEDVYDRRENRTLLGQSIDDTQNTVTVTLKQPLFRGGGEYAFLRQTKLARERAAAETLAERRTLYMRVAQLYYQILNLQSQLANHLKVGEVYGSMIRDLKYRARIGRSRATDLNSVRTQLALTESNISQTQMNINVAARDFSTLTGIENISSLQEEPLPREGAAHIKYDSALLDRQPDIRISQLNGRIATEEVKVQRSPYLPFVDLYSSYYARQIDTSQNGETSVGVRATWRFFNGGVTRAQVAEARLAARQKKLAAQETRELVASEIDKSIARITDLRVVAKKYEVAVATAEKNLELYRRDYKNGLVSQLDVLQALKSLFDVKISYERAKLDLNYEHIHTQLLLGNKDASL